MERFLEQILNFPRQFKDEELEFLNLARFKKSGRPDGLVIVGMGGSGLPGELIKGLGPQIGLHLPIVVWKDYGLPKVYFSRPLFIFISFSGNTEETLSAFKKALAQKSNLCVVTGGGELKKLAQRFNVPAVFLKKDGLTPRQSLGKMYFSVIKLLRLEFPRLKISPPKTINHKNLETAKVIANKLHGKIVLVYTSSSYKHIGYIWKINLNETAKVPAFTNFVPEMDHNEITGFENQKFPFVALFLIDPSEKKVAKKMLLTQKIMKTANIQTEAIPILGKSMESKTWQAIILSELVSFYLAKINQVDPAATRLIDELKRLSD